MPRTPVRIARPLAAALAVLATTGAAAAVHAALLRTEPEAGAIVARAPESVRLWFSEPVEPASDPVEVFDPRGARVDSGGGVSPDDVTRMEARVRDAGPGTYTVRWHVVSEDGHVVSGVHLYSVERQTRTDPAGEAPAPSSASITAARIAQGIGATVAVGAVVLALLLGAPSPGATRPLTTLGATGSLAALVGAGLAAWAQNAAIGGAPAEGAVSSGTIWGALWATRAVAAAGLLALFLTARGGRTFDGLRRGGSVALSAALVIAIAADGHARATPPVWIGLPVQALHLAATCAWLGGAAAFFTLLRSELAERELIDLVPRFSTMSLSCVVTLILTGLYQTWSHVARLALLTSTDYGETLLVKIGLIGVIAVPASINRFVVRPGLAKARAGEASGLVGRLGRMIGLEVAVGALVVVFGAKLATMPPPVELPAAPAVTAAAAALGEGEVRTVPFDGGTLELALDPAKVGSNEARLTLRDPDGGARDPGILRVRATPPAAAGLAASLTTFASDGPARRATLQLDAPGEWSLEVSDAAGRSAVIRITVE